VIGAGFGYRAPVWVSAGLVALAFAVAATTLRRPERAVGQEAPLRR
jgi:DHA1 family chloramphenicol resistance protein-like MFS transporter